MVWSGRVELGKAWNDRWKVEVIKMELTDERMQKIARGSITDEIIYETHDPSMPIRVEVVYDDTDGFDTESPFYVRITMVDSDDPFNTVKVVHNYAEHEALELAHAILSGVMTVDRAQLDYEVALHDANRADDELWSE